MFQILINREEKENFFFKILKMEKRKKMKIQFFRARGSERGQYFSRFLEIRDSCPCLRWCHLHSGCSRIQAQHICQAPAFSYFRSEKKWPPWVKLTVPWSLEEEQVAAKPKTTHLNPEYRAMFGMLLQMHASMIDRNSD